MPIVKKLLDKHGYVKRKVQKKLAIGHTVNRNEQFENIKRLKEEYSNIGEPIISIEPIWYLSIMSELSKSRNLCTPAA